MQSHADAAPARWVENRPPDRWWPRGALPELWAHRELALSLAQKDLAVRYKQTFFGVGWAILQPLLATLLFTVVFGRFAHLPADGLPYVVFAFAGMTIWLYVSSTVSAAAQSLVDNRDLVTKVYFPRLVSPVATLGSGLVALAISLVVLAVLMGIKGVAPGWQIVTLPLWLLVAVAVALAVGLWLSALNVKYRDVKHVLAFALQLWLFASPVGYSSSIITGAWRWLYAANPVVGVLDGFRWAVAGAQAPPAADLVSLAVGLVLLLGGFVYFRRLESHFADLI